MIIGIEITSVFKWMMVYHFYIEPTRPVLDIRRGSLIVVIRSKFKFFISILSMPYVKDRFLCVESEKGNEDIHSATAV